MRAIQKIIEGACERFAERYPNSNLRFARIIGRRVSDLCGTSDEVYPSEQQLQVTDDIIMYVHNGDSIADRDLQALAAVLGARLRGEPRRGH
jgi:hypothetical protein